MSTDDHTIKLVPESLVPLFGQTTIAAEVWARMPPEARQDLIDRHANMIVRAFDASKEKP